MIDSDAVHPVSSTIPLFNIDEISAMSWEAIIPAPSNAGPAAADVAKRFPFDLSTISAFVPRSHKSSISLELGQRNC